MLLAVVTVVQHVQLSCAVQLATSGSPTGLMPQILPCLRGSVVLAT